MQRKHRGGGGGAGWRETKPGRRAPPPPPLAPPSSRAPSPSTHTWANNGGKAAWAGMVGRNLRGGGGPGNTSEGSPPQECWGAQGPARTPSITLRGRPGSRHTVHAKPSLRAPLRPSWVGGGTRPAWGRRTCSRSPTSGRGRGPGSPWGGGAAERESRVRVPGVSVGGVSLPSPPPTGPWPVLGHPGQGGGRDARLFRPASFGFQTPGPGCGGRGAVALGAQTGGVPESGRAGTNTSRARREAQGRPERAR